MPTNYVSFTTYSNGNDEEDYSVVKVLDEQKNEVKIYQTDNDLVANEVLIVLEKLADANIITLSIKHKG